MENTRKLVEKLRLAQASEQRNNIALLEDAAQCIEWLQCEWDIAHKNNQKQREHIAFLTTELANMKNERYQAIVDLNTLRKMTDFKCFACINDKFDCDKGMCRSCELNDSWQWRGFVNISECNNTDKTDDRWAGLVDEPEVTSSDKKERCGSCGGMKYRAVTRWEGRLLKFHCMLYCSGCNVIANGFGITPKRAYKEAMKVRRRRFDNA